MRTHRARSLSLAALAAVSLLAAGCGGGDEEDVKRAVKEIATEAKDKDYEKFCDGLTDKAREQIQQRFGKAGGVGCPKLFEAIDRRGALSKRIGDPNDIKFEKVTVEGDRATVKEKGDRQPSELVKEDGEWKVDSAD